MLDARGVRGGRMEGKGRTPGDRTGDRMPELQGCQNRRAVRGQRGKNAKNGTVGTFNMARATEKERGTRSGGTVIVIVLIAKARSLRIAMTKTMLSDTSDRPDGQPIRDSGSALATSQ